MKYYLVVGEASGDLHASNLMKSLKIADKDAEFRFFGGDLMQSVGGTLVKHYKELAFMGFIPVLLNLRTIFRNMDICRKDMTEWRPDVVILVDYPGFNLKIAKYVKTKLKVPVYYYISPKIWAWKTYRIRDVKKYVDKMFSILPFETDFYQQHDFPVYYVGNPTVDAVAERELADESPQAFRTANALTQQPVIAVLPGSRRQEIKDNLPDMLKAIAAFPDYQTVIAGAPGIDPDYYRQYTGNSPVKIVFNQTYRLLKQADAALVTSGTATLETSLFRTPQLVCYQTPIKHIVSFVFETFFHVKYISLVNLIADRTIVKELFARYFSSDSIRKELDRILHDKDYRQRMLDGYDEVINILGRPGASQRAAELMVGFLSASQKTDS